MTKVLPLHFSPELVALMRAALDHCVRTAAAEHHYAELATILAPEAKGSATDRTNALVQTLRDLPVELNLPTRLRDVGIADKDIRRLAEDAMKQTRLNNPRYVSYADAMEI